MSPRGDLAVVIPARNESDRISATVKAAARLPGVDIVVVVDDGSADGTACEAAAAGAIVARHARGRGKSAAMETGAEAVAVIEAERAAAGEHRDSAGKHGAGKPSAGKPSAGKPSAGKQRARHLLFLDADLGATAADAGPLAEPVRSGEADMTIAVFASRVKLGGHGMVLGLSGAGIERTTGWRPAEPLNGQRCLTRAAFEAARPLAAGWGAETGLTIDLLRKGMRIVEVRVPLAHRATGRDLRSHWHRARQLTDIARALAVRQPWQQADARQEGQVVSASAGKPRAGKPRAGKPRAGKQSDTHAAGRAGAA
jgi:hypothetical protein